MSRYLFMLVRYNHFLTNKNLIPFKYIIKYDIKRKNTNCTIA